LLIIANLKEVSILRRWQMENLPKY